MDNMPVSDRLTPSQQNNSNKRYRLYGTTLSRPESKQQKKNKCMKEARE